MKSDGNVLLIRQKPATFHHVHPRIAQNHQTVTIFNSTCSSDVVKVVSKLEGQHSSCTVYKNRSLKHVTHTDGTLFSRGGEVSELYTLSNNSQTIFRIFIKIPEYR